LEKWTDDILTIATEVAHAGKLQPGQLLVVGTSTSEVIGEHIGSGGTTDVAEAIFKGLREFQQRTGCELAFQCCEHLNRALVVERNTAERYQLEIVTVIPVPQAGGAMASYAYRNLQDPVVVEQVKAHAGIDIGETLIGMHLRSVAVPFRPSIRHLGSARVNAAITRPKLIGGARAVYQL
jgi:uncharacterized protein (TIGR01440 family)